jgi:transcriptional antiterminator NusG
MTEPERQYINWLWNGGKPIEPSKVYVTSDGQKLFLSGALRKYSGEAAIDIRRRRVKISISICGVYRRITFPIELV